MVDGKVKSLNEILLNTLRSFISHKIIKFDYRHPNWMNPKSISSLRNRSNLSKRYYSNPTEENKNFRYTNSKECSNTILKAK